MTQEQALDLFQRIRADYITTLRDNHGLKRLKSEFDPAALPLIVELDKAIRDLTQGTKGPEITAALKRLTNKHNYSGPLLNQALDEVIAQNKKRRA